MLSTSSTPSQQSLRVDPAIEAKLTTDACSTVEPWNGPIDANSLLHATSSTKSLAPSNSTDWSNQDNQIRIDLRTFKNVFKAINQIGLPMVTNWFEVLLSKDTDPNEVTQVIIAIKRELGVDAPWLQWISKDQMQRFMRIFTVLKEDAIDILSVFLPENDRSVEIPILADDLSKERVGFKDFSLIAKEGAIYLVEQNDYRRPTKILTLANFLSSFYELKTLRGLDLSYLDLRGASIAGFDLRETILCQTNLNGEDLTYANFGHAQIEEADLGGAILINADFTAARLKNTTLCGANMSGADFSRAQLRSANMRMANLSNADFSNAYIGGSNSDDPRYYSSDFHKANLTGTDFCGAELNCTAMMEVVLTGARFDDSTEFQSLAISLDLPKQWTEAELLKHLAPSRTASHYSLFETIANLNHPNGPFFQIRLIHQIIASLKDVDITPVHMALSKALSSHEAYLRDDKIIEFIKTKELAILGGPIQRKPRPERVIPEETKENKTMAQPNPAPINITVNFNNERQRKAKPEPLSSSTSESTMASEKQVKSGQLSSNTITAPQTDSRASSASIVKPKPVRNKSSTSESTMTFEKQVKSGQLSSNSITAPQTESRASSASIVKSNEQLKEAKQPKFSRPEIDLKSTSFVPVRNKKNTSNIKPAKTKGYVLRENYLFKEQIQETSKTKLDRSA